MKRVNHLNICLLFCLFFAQIIPLFATSKKINTTIINASRIAGNRTQEKLDFKFEKGNIVAIFFGTTLYVVGSNGKCGFKIEFTLLLHNNKYTLTTLIPEILIPPLNPNTTKFPCRIKIPELNDKWDKIESCSVTIYNQLSYKKVYDVKGNLVNFEKKLDQKKQVWYHKIISKIIKDERVFNFILITIIVLVASIPLLLFKKKKMRSQKK